MSEGIVKLLREAADEIESLRAQLAEVARERNSLLLDAERYGPEKLASQKAEFKLAEVTQQLLATQAHAARLTEVLECYAKNKKIGLVASVAISTPINLDALHEALALECERLANVAGDEPEHVKALFSEWLREEAAAHRAKKEGK